MKGLIVVADKAFFDMRKEQAGLLGVDIYE